ncbi:MAG: peptidoglycan DD-metalloendopeptidase family protein [Ktedonobacteraceae bacterium]|nr:peptidoglycan DD-metalloendopeptidase family protein [Ktedonobacteraceae bacterium]
MIIKKQAYLLLTITAACLLAIASAASALFYSSMTDLEVNATELSAASGAPFLYRPYYGNQSVLQRTISFVDHDKPWYASDGVFVRYDGRTWKSASLSSCSAGVNCYDGHNGYDLNLYFEPVLSAARGKVIRAGWYNQLNHNASFGLWVAIDHGNGIATAYGHLSAITVAVGDTVGNQWQIGTSGTTGSATGPHLHMSTYYLPRWQATDPFGWSGRGRDPNIVADRYLWTSRPAAPQQAPRLAGRATYPGAILVDDGGPGWSSSGRWTRSAGNSDIRGALHWTTTAVRATATATWTPRLPRDGYYEVGVFVNDNHASSGWAPYTIYSADPGRPGVEVRHVVYVDQSHIGSFAGAYGRVNTGPQWVSIGSYYFRANMHGRVVLSNGTGGSGAQIAADAVEFVPM